MASRISALRSSGQVIVFSQACRIGLDASNAVAATAPDAASRQSPRTASPPRAKTSRAATTSVTEYSPSSFSSRSLNRTKATAKGIARAAKAHPPTVRASSPATPPSRPLSA